MLALDGGNRAYGQNFKKGFEFKKTFGIRQEIRDALASDRQA